MSDASVDTGGGGGDEQNLVPDDEDDSVGSAHRRRDPDESSSDGPKSSSSSMCHNESDLSHCSSDNDQDEERAAGHFGLHPNKAREWRGGQNGRQIYDDAGPLREGKMRAIDNNGCTIHVSKEKTGDNDEHNFEERLEAKVNTVIFLLTDIQSLMMNQLDTMFASKIDLSETKHHVKNTKDLMIELGETVEGVSDHVKNTKDLMIELGETVEGIIAIKRATDFATNST